MLLLLQVASRLRGLQRQTAVELCADPGHILFEMSGRNSLKGNNALRWQRVAVLARLEGFRAAL